MDKRIPLISHEDIVAAITVAAVDNIEEVEAMIAEKKALLKKNNECEQNHMKRFRDDLMERLK